MAFIIIVDDGYFSDDYDSFDEYSDLDSEFEFDDLEDDLEDELITLFNWIIIDFIEYWLPDRRGVITREYDAREVITREYDLIN